MMKADFKKWLQENNRNAEGILISSFMPTTNTWKIFNQFAEDYAVQKNAELKKYIAYFAYWYENMKGNTDAFTMTEFEEILYPEFLKEYTQKLKDDES